MKTQDHFLRRVFVWELPVRIYHWLNALAIVALCVTGYLIGNPPSLMSQEEASFRYLFGTIRFIHFVAAYLFFFNFLFRIYWGFVGNKYANWHNFIPTTKKYLQEIWDVLRIDIFLMKNKEHLSVGHNALAGATYFFMFLAFLLQCVTGFGLYAAMSDWWFPQMFWWVSGVFGGDFALRNWHHAAMWFFVVFAIVHVYLVLYHDYVEGRGEVSSMFGGWKFIEEEVFEAEEAKEKAA
ncbi:MAG: Ni/Fe-hydrogenase, b-type cytochrome subunit [Saprospiraceae bacterium]|nr:Ni/Fe-hydrogenase, b-type cytochrome subunit [Saprospiraceae bacterium]